MMRTGASGMNAQATRLSAVADNVANVTTVGYKAASCDFSTLLLSTTDMNYESGSVLAKVRQQVSTQGGLNSSASMTDLGISGNGFFLVSNAGGTPLLTRAGSFVPDGDGNLVNAAGFTLLGYKIEQDEPDIIVNGFTNLEPVNFATLALTASPSTQGELMANLPAEGPVISAADLPSLNTADARFTSKSSFIVYDNLGGDVKLDIYFSKIADNSWEIAVYDGGTAAANGGFPYGSAALATGSLEFGTNGELAAGSMAELSFTVPEGADFTLDVSRTTQFDTDYMVLSAKSNGSPAGRPDNVEIARDGYVYALYDSGTRIPVYRIPLGQVTSPNGLTPLPGNVYAASAESGAISVGFGGTEGLGNIISGALEQSTVDLAGELTTMIDAQRSYTANSKVFQTGAELMDVLVNLKR